LERRREVSLADPSVMFTYFPRPVFTARGSQRWSLRAEQRFPFPGKLSLRRKIAEGDAVAATLRADDLENRLIFEVKQAYYRLYRMDRQLELAREFQQRLSVFEEAASSRYAVGLGQQQEILKAQLERGTLGVLIEALEADRTSTEKELARLLNFDKPEHIEPMGVISLPDPPNIPIETIVDSALTRHPEVAMLDTLMNNKRLEVSLAKKEWLPDLGIHASYISIAQEEIPASADGQDAFAIGASIRIPLFGGNRNVGVSRAQLEQTQLELDRIAIETEVRTHVDDLVSRLKRESRQMKLFAESLIPQAETTVEVTLSGYTSGRIGFLDLLDAERMLFALRNHLEETIEHYAIASAELERTVGGSIVEFTTPYRETP